MPTHRDADSGGRNAARSEAVGPVRSEAIDPARSESADASPSPLPARLRLLAAVGALVLVAAVLAATPGVLHPAVATHPWIAAGTLVAAAWLTVGRRAAALRRAGVRLLDDGAPWLVGVVLAAAGTATFGWLSHALFQAVPHIDDGVAALFQARIFAAGHWSWPIDPAIARDFDLFGVVEVAGRPELRSGMYPPGLPALLALGVLGGAPWLVNPLLGGLLAVAVVALGHELFGRRAGRIAGVLVVTSPLVGVVSATHLAHTATALACTVAWWSVARLGRRLRGRDAVMAGAAMGGALLVRPATAGVMGCVIVIGALPGILHVLRRPRLVAAGLVPLLIAAALLGAFQQATNGDPFRMGHEREMIGAARMGFGPISISSRVHTPREAVHHTVFRLAALDRDLLGWPLGSLVFALLPLLVVRAGRRELWLAAPLVVLAGFYALYWYYEEFLPGRYLFAAVPMLLVLAARGWQLGTSVLAARPGWRRLPTVVLVWGLLFAVLAAGPDRHARIGPHHGDVEANLPRLLAAHPLANALVLVGAVGRRALYWGSRNDYYATAFMRNDLDLDGDVVFARDLADHGAPSGAGAMTAVGTTVPVALRDAYPGRVWYRYVFDRASGASWLDRLTLEQGRVTGETRVAEIVTPY